MWEETSPEKAQHVEGPQRSRYVFGMSYHVCERDSGIGIVLQVRFESRAFGNIRFPTSVCTPAIRVLLPPPSSPNVLIVTVEFTNIR